MVKEGRKWQKKSKRKSRAANETSTLAKTAGWRVKISKTPKKSGELASGSEMRDEKWLRKAGKIEKSDI